MLFLSIGRTSKKWLDAQSEQNTTLRALPSYLQLVDLKSDDYFRLVTVEIPQSLTSDVKPKLKVYKGTTLISEQNLPGIPSSVRALYVDDREPRIPGLHIFHNIHHASALNIPNGDFSGRCRYWRICVFLQKYETIFQVHISLVASRCARTRDLAKGKRYISLFALLNYRFCSCPWKNLDISKSP